MEMSIEFEYIYYYGNKMESYSSNKDKWGVVEYMNTTILWKKDDESEEVNSKNMYSISETCANFFCKCYCYPHEIQRKAQQLYSNHMMLAKTWKY